MSTVAETYFDNWNDISLGYVLQAPALSAYHQQPKWTISNRVTVNGVDVKDDPDFTSDLAFEVMVLTLDMGYPVGVECTECRQCFNEGDVVLAGQKRKVGWVGWHTRCLKSILEDSPLDEFEITKNKLENGEDPFE